LDGNNFIYHRDRNKVDLRNIKLRECVNIDITDITSPSNKLQEYSNFAHFPARAIIFDIENIGSWTMNGYNLT
jgi:hypothetical protein